MHGKRFFAGLTFAAALVSQWCPANSAPTQKRAPLAFDVPRQTDMNAATIGLAGGLLEGSFIRYAADIAKVLDDGDKLRVIPLVTFGAVGNVTDLLYLKGVDVA